MVFLFPFYLIFTYFYISLFPFFFFLLPSLFPFLSAGAIVYPLSSPLPASQHSRMPASSRRSFYTCMGPRVLRQHLCFSPVATGGTSLLCPALEARGGGGGGLPLPQPISWHPSPPAPRETVTTGERSQRTSASGALHKPTETHSRLSEEAQTAVQERWPEGAGFWCGPFPVCPFPEGYPGALGKRSPALSPGFAPARWDLPEGSLYPGLVPRFSAAAPRGP